jgi:hypothetical protein
MEMFSNFLSGAMELIGSVVIFLLLFIFMVMAAVIISMLNSIRRHKQVKFIKNYSLPKGLYSKVKRKYPDIGPKEFQLVAKALDQYFLAYLESGQKFVAMPSQAVDELWHEFILYTREYHQFCKNAFGSFMHHTPAIALKTAKTVSSKSDNEGLRRVWWYCCKEEGIDPRNATRMPLLFAIDKKLGIANGYHYKLDCKNQLGKDYDNNASTSSGCGGGGSAHCTSDFSDSSIDGGTDGFGDSDSGSSDGGDGGGGDSGCGGGGCGGGGD